MALEIIKADNMTHTGDTARTSAFLQLGSWPGRKIFPGFRGRFVHAKGMTVAHWTIEAGNVVPEHAHHQEQIVNLLSGRFEMTVGEEVMVMEPGDVAVIASWVTHSARALTDCTCIDVFTPGRPDYTNEEPEG